MEEEIVKPGPIKSSIPNFITLTGMGFGLAGMSLVALGRTRLGLWLFIYSVLIDKLDGFAARRLGVTSEVGFELDSLSDMVCFGIAPAFSLIVIAFRDWQIELLSPPGIFVAFAGIIYAWMTALRLAKFNVQTHEFHKFFVGMASTHAGALVVTMLLVGLKYNFGMWFHSLAPAVFIAAAALMVSRVLIPKLGYSTRKSYRILQGILVPITYFLGFAMLLPEVLFALALIYLLIGALIPKKGVNDGPEGEV